MVLFEGNQIRGGPNPRRTKSASTPAKTSKLRNGSAKSLGWDEIIPETHVAEWITFFEDWFEMKEISFLRCIKPVNSTGSPSMVIFNDGSNDALGACALCQVEER